MKKPTFIKNNCKKDGKFSDGSRLVLGTSGLGGVWGEVEEEESVEAILYAFEQGVEVVDTAPSYNEAQKYLGKALRRWKGKRPFISTKIGRLKAEDPNEIYLDYSPEGMCESIHRSLELLGIEKIDLLFLHEPQLVPLEKMDSIMDTLLSFQEDGLVDMLGVGGNPEDGFWPYLKQDNFEVVSSFLKMDACTLEGFNHDIPRFCEEGLAIYAASSLHMGLLGSKFKDYVENPPDSDWIKQSHIDNAVKINTIAHNHNMSITELALRYLFSMKEADRVVLGPKNIEEVKISLNIFEKGALEEEIFNQVTEVLLKSNV